MGLLPNHLAYGYNLVSGNNEFTMILAREVIMAKKSSTEDMEARSKELDEIRQRVAALELLKQEASPVEKRLLIIAKAAYVALVHHAVAEPPTDEYIRTRTVYYANLINKSEDENEMAKHLEEVIEEMRTYRKSRK